MAVLNYETWQDVNLNERYLILHTRKKKAVMKKELRLRSIWIRLVMRKLMRWLF